MLTSFQLSGRDILQEVVLKQTLQFFHDGRGELELSADLSCEMSAFISSPDSPRFGWPA